MHDTPETAHQCTQALVDIDNKLGLLCLNYNTTAHKKRSGPEKNYNNVEACSL